MARLLGVLFLVVGLYALQYYNNPDSLSGANLQPVALVQGYFGVLTLGVSILIISGGIDLSIGSVVALSAMLFGLFVTKGVSPYLALFLVLCVGVMIGVFHGLLVTRLKLQPFLVTLCGMFAYRGLALYFGNEKAMGLGTLRGRFEVTEGEELTANQIATLDQLRTMEQLTSGNLFGIPNLLVLLFVLGGIAAIFLHASIHGRYLFAIGGNEQAARYAGVPVERYKILAYVICSTLAALGGFLELMRAPSVQPSNGGASYELYAITGAVLGGCSLSGGEGNIPGILLGTFVLPIVRNLTTWVDALPRSLEYTIIGVVLLLGTVADEWFKRRAARRG